jgi:iron complex transport system permease protein
MIISQTGSLIQLSTRNILASPSTLGFDGLSILWILIFHSVLISLNQDQTMSLLLLTGLPCFIVIGFLYSRALGKFRNLERLILMGLTFNLLVGAIFSLWQFLFLAFNLPFPVELWFGHFRFADSDVFSILLGFESLILAGWLILNKEIHLFSLGKTISENYHLKYQQLFSYLFICVSLGTFGIVSLFGAFSFLGLIFPIFARKLWFKKFDLKGEIIYGSILNGGLLMMIDSLCYYFPIYGAEVPVGLVATAVGALSLIFLLWNSELLAKKQK